MPRMAKRGTTSRLPVLTAVAALCFGFAAGNARAERLVFSGATFWNLPIYGVVTSPRGDPFPTEKEIEKLRGVIVEDGDTLVYDFATESFEVFEAVTPSQLITEDDDFAMFDPESDAVLARLGLPSEQRANGCPRSGHSRRHG
jgi:hypothetical protein